ncbi:hypothetical protein [Bacillus piscicola]|uniref:hypothetical protein n=1 Tax=Bacillus piscicola TaxID=1632684 RepID=UPI001F09EE60|nr:hypothetical protein [Bacillus piscicola]
MTAPRTEWIKTEELTFDQEEVKKVLESLDKNQEFTVEQLLYYPYYFFEYKLERRSLLQPKGGGSVGCAMDAVNKVGSVIDKSPVFTEKEVPSQQMIPVELEETEAKKLAVDFLNHSITYRMKILAPPQMKLTRSEIFYRPYWVAEGTKAAPDGYTLIVDAISGKYHPL